jgi:hypothetical protein
MIDKLFLFFFPPLFILVVTNQIVLVRIVSRLRQAHPATYESWGRPRLLTMGRANRESMILLRFIFNGDHASLGDRRLSRLVERARWLTSASLAFLAGLLLLFFVSLVAAEFSGDDEMLYGPQPATGFEREGGVVPES